MKRLWVALVAMVLASGPLQADSAHSDHTPKHGGQFFMAPDKFHHLEAAMPSRNEFRVYLYDDHTKAISAKPFLPKTTLEVDRMNTNGREVGKPIRLPVQIGPEGKYLKAELPWGVTFPLYYSLRIAFPQSQEPELFNFVFSEVSQEKKVSGTRPVKKASPRSTENGKVVYACPMNDSPAQRRPGRCQTCGMNLERRK